MKPLHTIKDIKQVRVLADPLRLRITELLSQKAMTARQVADKLEDKPSDLYYHFNQLENVGLIEQVKTKRKGNLLEKYYRTVAQDFAIHRSLFRLQGNAFQEMVEGILEATRKEMAGSLEAGRLSPEDEDNHITIRKKIRGGREEIKSLYKELENLMKRCEKLAQSMEGEQEYGLTLLFYPLSVEKSAEDSDG